MMEMVLFMEMVQSFRTTHKKIALPAEKMKEALKKYPGGICFGTVAVVLTLPVLVWGLGKEHYAAIAFVEIVVYMAASFFGNFLRMLRAASFIAERFDSETMAEEMRACLNPPASDSLNGAKAD